MLGKKIISILHFSFIFHIYFLFLSFHIKLPSETAALFEKVSSYTVILGVARRDGCPDWMNTVR